MLTYLDELQHAIKGMNLAELETLCELLKQCRTGRHRLFVCGNGGSHAVATHWGVDLIKVGYLDTHVLGTNQALLTALANDLDYEVGLSTELSVHARPGDVLVALSCSGRSRNIVSVLNEARKLQLTTYLLTGSKAPERSQVRTVRVYSNDYGILEDVFSAVGHWLARELS